MYTFIKIKLNKDSETFQTPDRFYSYQLISYRIYHNFNLKLNSHNNFPPYFL